MMWRAFALACLVSVSGCTEVRSRFDCSDDAQCRSESDQGVCEPTGFCSFPDSECAHGRRYRRGAGEISNECVGCVRAIAAGGYEASDGSRGVTCAVRREGSVWCWGDAASGQIGPDADDEALRPTRVASIDDAVQAAVGNRHVCAVRSNGTVACWGDNAEGQLGREPSDADPTPKTVDIDDVVGVTTGEAHTCARSASGRVHCWGANDSGELGDGTEMARAMPNPVTGLEDVKEVAAGSKFTCARRDDGTVWCWGGASLGQLGNGSTDTDIGTPVQVRGIDDARALRAGEGHACVLHADRGVSCWGRNDFGQLGDGTFAYRSVPIRVRDVPPLRRIAAGSRHTCGIGAEGEVWCWGQGVHGALGDGIVEPGHRRASPARVSSLDGEAVQLALGARHSCVHRSDSAVWCWGGGDFGELGDGMGESSGIPVAAAFDCGDDR